MSAEEVFEWPCPGCGKDMTVTCTRMAFAFAGRQCTQCLEKDLREVTERERLNQAILRVNRSNLPVALRRKRLDPGPLRDVAGEWAKHQVRGEVQK